MKMNPDLNYSCTLCGKTGVNKYSLVMHIEAIHFPEMFQHNCGMCGKSAKSKMALYKHISRHHKKGNHFVI